MATGFGTTDDLAALAATNPGPTASSQGYINQLVTLAGADPQDQQAITRAMRDWLNLVIRPLFVSATTDAQLVLAFAELNRWVETPFVAGFPSEWLTILDGPFTSIKALGANKLQQAVAANNAVCAAQESYSALRNVLFWQTQAAVLGVATAQYGLDRATILAGLCARVVLESVTLPSPLTVGTDYSLVTVWGVRFEGQATSQGAPFRVEYVGNGMAVQNPTGFSNNTGTYESVVRPLSSGVVAVDVQGCLILPPDQSGTVTDVCNAATITRSASDPVAPPPPPPPPPPSGVTCGGTLTPPTGPGGVITTDTSDPTVLDAIRSAETIDGALIVAFADARSPAELTFPCLKHVARFLGIGPNNVLTRLEFPALQDVGLHVNMSTNRALTTARFPVLAEIGASASPGGSFSVNTNAVLTLLEVGPVTIRRNAPGAGGGMQLIQPLPVLESLSAMSSGITADTLFFTLPGTGQTGFTEAEVRFFGTRANFNAVCEILANNARKCE